MNTQLLQFQKNFGLLTKRSVTRLVALLFILSPFWCKGQQWKLFNDSNSALISNDVRNLAKDSRGTIYAGTVSGLSFFKNGIWQPLSVSYLNNPGVSGVWTAHDSVWVGTEYNGLWGYFNNAWINYDPNSAGNGVIGLGKDSRDSLYRLDKFSNFDLWNGAGWVGIRDFFSPPYNLFVDRVDNIWLLGNGGLSKYKNGSFTSWTGSLDTTSPGGMPSGTNYDMLQDKAGIYWIASNDGLIRFDGKYFKVYNITNSGIASNSTTCLALDSTGKLWIGTRDAGISTFNGSTWATYNVANSAISSPLINDIIVDSANNIWIANGSNPNMSPSGGQGIFILDEDKDFSNGRLPAVPLHLTGRVISDHQVILQWIDSSDNENAFLLERSATDSLHFTQIKSLINNTTSFTDMQVADTAYYYRIRATNGRGNSAYSNIVKAKPAYCEAYSNNYGAYAIIKKVSFGSINKETPDCVSRYLDFLSYSTDLFAGKTLMLTVAFDRCNITSDPIIGGVVYIDWNSDGDFVDDGEMVYSNININGKGEYNIPVTVPSYVTPGTITRMRIRAEDDVYTTPILPCGYGEQTQDYTLQIINPTLVFTPASLSAKPLSSRKIQVNWEDNSSAETGYGIERSLDSIQFSLIAQLAPNTIQYTDSSVQPNTRYYYRITAKTSGTSAVSGITGASTLPADLVRQWSGDAATDAGFNAGAFWGDFNNDGKYDLYAPGNNALYVNQDSVLTRTNLPFLSSSSAAWADFDNDGDQDIYVTDYLYGGSGEAPSLYENNGDATFTKRAIFVADGRINNCVWTDYDGDGFLDLYVSYLDLGYGKLYRNNGNKTFTLARQFNNAGGFASFADYDNDGDDDLFVLGYGQAAVFKLQDSVFTPVSISAFTFLTTYPRGVSWADFDNDGDLDLFVPGSNAGNPSYLYINTGGDFYPVLLPEIDGQAYGSAWGDYDNDGLQDLFVSCFQKTNKLFRNVNGTLSQLPESVYVNEDFSAFPYDEGSSLGCAWADYNNDGFLDLYVAESNGEASKLYKNGGNANNWINILLKGTVSNHNGIGALIRLKANGKWQYRTIQSTSGFAGENSIAAEFGLGKAATIDSLIIKWPSGIVQALNGIQRNQFLTVTEPNICINNTWTGNAGTAWENPGNWSCGTLPDSNSKVVIPAGKIAIIQSNVTVRKLSLFPTSKLTVNSNYKLNVLH